MTNNTEKKATVQLNIFQEILVVFVILKLVPGTDIYNWSWFWVLSPFWIPFVVIVLYYFIMNVGKR